MLITESELRRLIKKALIAEAAMTPEDVKAAGIKIGVRLNNDYVDIMASRIESEGFREKVAELSAVRAESLDKGGPCSGAFSIYWSRSSINGLGPLLYDLMIDLIHPSSLTSDREEVSSDAKSVWDYYDTYRHDIEADQLDDMNNTLTTSEDDNCPQLSAQLWSKSEKSWPESSLSRAYRRFDDNTPTLDALRKLKAIKFISAHGHVIGERSNSKKQ